MTEKHTYTWLFSDFLFSEAGQNSILGQAKHVDIKISLQKILQQIFIISWDYQLFTLGFIHKISPLVFEEANWLLRNAAKDYFLQKLVWN